MGSIEYSKRPAHDDLTDMPSATVSGHDQRYYTQAEIHEIIAGELFNFFLSDTADGVIANYSKMFDADTGEAQSTVVAAGVSSDATLIKAFITESTQPTFVVLSEGVYEFHFHAKVNVVSASYKTVKLYFELYKRATNDLETLLMTSEESGTLIASEKQETIHAFLSGDELLNSDDRLVLKVYANIEDEGPPNNPDVTIFMEGTTTTRIGVRTTLTAFDDRYVQRTDSIDALADVDTTTTPPVRDDVPKWNGNQWVPAAYDYTFEFSIVSFSDGMSSADELIGDGIWKATGAITFTASYDNGPPTNADVDISGAASGWGSPLDMMGDNNGSGPTINTEAVVYPSSNGGAVTFTLTSNVNGDEDTAADGASKKFYNYFKYDDLDHNSGFDDADITSLASQIISNDITRGFSQSIGASNYLVIAHRTGDGSIAQVRCGTGTNEITVAMNKNDETTVTPLKETIGHTNSAGNPKTEDFYVYASKLQNLDAHSPTFTTLSSSTPKNYIRYGGSTKASGYDEADVEGLDEGESTTDHTQTWDQIDLDAFEYFIFAMPSRFATPTFFDNDTGFEAAFEDPEIVSVTNACGFKEDYKVFRSENILGPGTFTLRTQ